VSQLVSNYVNVIRIENIRFKCIIEMTPFYYRLVERQLVLWRLKQLVEMVLIYNHQTIKKLADCFYLEKAFGELYHKQNSRKRE
jgi:hypothetical protein